MYGYKSKKYINTNPHIYKIGITGSNGKTSIKNILYQLLTLKYVTVFTPKNYNTPQGIKYTITKLCDKKTQAIIFEMGARNKHDISKLCKLTDVNFGIVSCCANQHIETFKNINNVYYTKKELPDYLNQKLCIFNYNNIYSRKMFENKTGRKSLVGYFLKHTPMLKQNKYLHLIQKTNTSIYYHRPYKFDLIARNVSYVNGCQYFDVEYKKKTYKFTTKLLGEHNITNILLSLCMAINLGIKISKTIMTIKHLEPTPHRLELTRTHIKILDDTYNCSIESAKFSLKVLAQFPNKKMVCTPGIIEGGKLQNELNKALLQMIEKVADYIIIIGKSNYKCFKENATKIIIYCNTLEDAKKHFNILSSNDTLLLLNDLPDDYK